MDSDSDASTADIIREWAGEEDAQEYVAKKSKKKIEYRAEAMANAAK